MKQENVDGLYGRLGRAVPKSKRESLKASLVKADNSKYAALSNMELASRSPLKGINGLICFFATLFGVIFLVCNMIAFLYISPKYASYSNYSAKISDDLSKYYAELSNYGSAGGAAASVPVLTFENEYEAIVTDYAVLYENLQSKEQAYNAKVAAYRTNLNYAGNRTANYLNYKVQLAGLEEPEEGVENYDDLKKQYDKKVEELNKKITDYETRVAGLEDDKAAIDAALEEYDGAAEACTDAMRAIIEWQKAYNRSEAFKESLYGIYLGGSEGIVAYMDNCNKQLNVQISAYQSALNTYKKATENIADLPAVIEADENRIVKVAENYETAKNNLTEYAATVAEYRAEYNKYVSDNAEDLAKYNKLIADVNDVLKTDEENDESEQKTKIAEAADKLLKTYETALKAFDDAADKEDKAAYRTAKYLYDTLNAAIDGKKEEQIPEAVKALLAPAEAWIEAYNAVIEEYSDNLSDYNTALSLLGLTSYSNLLVQRINLMGDTEAETFIADLEKLNDSIEKSEAAIAVYQEIIDGSDTWTEEYYINYCLNNTEDENFAAYKKAYEVISDADNTIGNSEKLTLINDQFKSSGNILDKEKAENEVLVAYYSIEQLSARLQTALNVAYELSENLNRYYGELDTSSKIDWLSINEDMRETVHVKLAYGEHAKILTEYLSGTKKVVIKTLFFDEFDISNGEQPDSVTEIISTADFKNKVAKYSDLVKDVNTFATDANSAVYDYQELPSVLEMLLMIFDIIMIVIYAAYFAYYVYDVNLIAKEKNYQKISDIINL